MHFIKHVRSDGGPRLKSDEGSDPPEHPAAVSVPAGGRSVANGGIIGAG